MCLIVFGLNAHPDYSLILIANRDEFFNRPTQSLMEWEKPDNIIAGKDITAGGTWLGLNKNGKLAAITNYRDPKNIKSNAPSRGQLALNFLKENIAVDNYLQNLRGTSEVYNGFNLLIRDQSGLYHFSNVDKKITQVQNGVHGLSNALLNSPWPKVVRAKQLLADAINHDELEDEQLRSILFDPSLADDKDLPKTGVPLSLEKQLSAMFIRIEGYGTRCTSVIKIKKNNEASFAEYTYNEKGRIAEHKIINTKLT